jgi:glycosyltransferase involved in cell wall biosynthesis
MKKFFSVIVPVHNAAEFMRKGMDSIFSQDFKDYEAIIVCDSCTDETEYIVNEYTAYTHHKKLFTDYGRAGMARNAGLDEADGEWILFMDDDDWYLPGAFGKIAEELDRQKDIDILAYGFEWKHMKTAYQSEARIYPAIWNKAWRREFIGDERFPDWIHTDDLGFAKRMHPRARFGFLHEALYYYNFMRVGSVSDKIRNGEYDNDQLPEDVRDAAIGYERWLKSKEF